MSRNHMGSQLSAMIVGLTIALSCLSISGVAQATQDDASAVKERQMLAKYEAAMAQGDKAKAIKYVLDYSEDAYGESSPVTVKLAHRYGKILYDDGEYRQAVTALKTALELSEMADGEFGGAAYELNMNVGYAYSRWKPTLSQRMRYFDRALEVLRENGKRETILYVTTLVNIITNMMENDGLTGSYSSTMVESESTFDMDENAFAIEAEYYNKFHFAKKYIVEAVELANKLKGLDEFLISKIAIAEAKLNVMETVDLAKVPMGVEGYISGGTEKDNYNREDKRLTGAIEDLSKDIERNSVFLTIANDIRMDIAWMRKDEERMKNMCANGALNAASEYPRENLFDIMEGGMVAAPQFNFRISKNIFRAMVNRGEPKKDRNGVIVRKPHFIPVCIDGRLMAALRNAPRVTVEEVE